MQFTAIKRLLTLAVLAIAGIGTGHSQLNPYSQLNWPIATGSGAPTATCQATYTGPGTVAYGSPYVDTTNFLFYSCTPSGWKNLTGGSGSGTVSGQANGVIPLATGPTTIGAQSHLDDGNTTAGTISSSEPIAVLGTGSGSHSFSGSTSGTDYLAAAPAAGTPSTLLLPTSDPTAGQLLQAAAPTACTGYSTANCTQLSYISPSTSTVVSQVVVSGTTTTTIASGAIPGTGTTLIIDVYAAFSDSAVQETMVCSANGDSASHYAFSYSSAASNPGSGTSAGTTTSGICGFVNAGSVSPQFSSYRIIIEGYSSATGYKSWRASGDVMHSTTVNDIQIVDMVTHWQQAAAITSFSLTDNNGGHFMPGSTVTFRIEP